MSSPISVSSGGIGPSGETTFYQSGGPGSYQFVVNLEGMGSGDTVKIRVYQKIVSNLKLIQELTYTNAQAVPAVRTDVFSTELYSNGAITFTVEVTAGVVGGGFDYTVLSF